jgi:two-component system chemotaxis sensor kinase CheA
VFGYFIFVGIRRNLSEVVRLNANLEGQVRARTETLVQREHSLRLVLDSTGDGLFEVDRSGKLAGTGSAAAVRWFGLPQPDASVASYLFPDDADQAAHFAASFDQLAEDILPWELCSDQMPRHVRRGTRTLALEFKRVLEREAFVKVLVVARDVTETLQAERAQQSAREQQSLIAKLLADKAGFAQFVKDSERLLSSLATAHELTVAKRDLHTLKGNVAIFGLSSLAEFCHAIEDRIAASGGFPTAVDVADLAALWRMRMQSIEAFLSELGDSRLEVDRLDHERLLESLLTRQDYAEIIGMVELWSWPRTSERLSRFRAHAEHLAKRLDKHVRVEIEHGELRAPSDYLERFWPTLIHVVRNAVDHGAESSEQRVARGKTPETEIVLVTRQTDDRFLVEVRDDGPGIDRATLLRKAREKGFELADSTALSDLVFMDGISSRDEVSEVSGRGVGLGAVRQACAAEGGSAEILTEPGRGTTFRFSFRQPVIKLGGLVERIEKRWSFRPTISAPPPGNSNAAKRSSVG